MKYVFFMMISLLFVGCDDKHPYEINGVAVGMLEKVEFEGHTYLIRNGYYKGGICHDENCKCKKIEVK